MELTKKQLNELLKKDYLISNLIDIIVVKNTYYIVYPYYMVRIIHFDMSGWSFSFHGDCNYSVCKHFIKLCDLLDENIYTPKKENK